MKRLMFIGPSQCGKTSLTQGLRGEALHYKKTPGYRMVADGHRYAGRISGEPLPV